MRETGEKKKCHQEAEKSAESEVARRNTIHPWEERCAVAIYFGLQMFSYLFNFADKSSDTGWMLKACPEYTRKCISFPAVKIGIEMVFRAFKFVAMTALPGAAQFCRNSAHSFRGLTHPLGTKVNAFEKWTSPNVPRRSPHRSVSLTCTPIPVLKLKFSYVASGDSAFWVNTSIPPFISR